MLQKTKTMALIYGHVGEGNLHIRPLIRRENWSENLTLLADSIFKTVLAYNGTISGEHGSGRNRARYLRNEWGDKIYGYFKEIKSIFDPANLLNPEIMFTEDSLTKNLQF
jgi:FAD/FMN-containing dehydrogenase